MPQPVSATAPVSTCLISLQGTGPADGKGYQVARYLDTEGQLVAETSSCAEAFVRHLHLGAGDSVLLLATEKSRALLPATRAALQPSGVRVEELQLPASGRDWHAWAAGLCERLAAGPGTPGRLVLDITQGYRADGTLVLMVLEFLSSFANYAIEDVCYARQIEGVHPTAFRLESLRDLRQAQQLVESARLLQQAGDVGPLVEALRSAEVRWRRANPGPLHGENLDRKKLVEELVGIGDGLSAGSLAEVQDRLRGLEQRLAAGDLGSLQQDLRLRPLLGALAELQQGCSPVGPSADGPSMELASNLIAWYAHRGNLPTAMLVASESLTSRLMVELGLGPGWQQRKQRQPVSVFLSALARLGGGSNASSKLAGLVSGLGRVVEYRNAFAHCFTSSGPDSVAAMREVKAIVEQVRVWLADAELWRELAGLYRSQPAVGDGMCRTCGRPLDGHPVDPA